MQQNKSDKTFTFDEILRKAESYCVYQERCHTEVILKLKTFSSSETVIDNAVVHLIEHNFLNEERFACSYARGKHRIKHWGRIRIVRELKARSISKYNIDKALKEIDPEEYTTNFNNLSERIWESITEPNSQKKKKKFCDYLLRKGFETSLIYEKLQDLT
ncbi:regulatory protein RecX [Flavobacterium macacae]|uniref:Regulatory protein RecX n=1 Tax=Flavobacterium macacae TaxID=2488993 RepID=A0A3P3WHA7_9FLAO|nr:regulatory protein RecX [Flavobacterium macacae]RRJ93927.1 RecX family transcriptional regulator [Flavobacterium macacae]